MLAYLVCAVMGYGQSLKRVSFCPCWHTCVPGVILNMLGSCVLKASVDRVSVDTIGRYGDRHSANISTDTQPMCRRRLGRVSVDMNTQACRPTPSRYFNATRPTLGHHLATTRPPLGRYFTNTWITLSSLGQLLLPSSIFPALLREAFSGRRPFLAFNSGNTHVFFPVMFFFHHHFYIRPSLLSDAAAFGDCCFWRLVILGEQKMI